MKVVIADDDSDIRAVLGDFLRLHGFEVFEASNGLEALWQVKHQIPEAILLDVRMPRLGGIDALKRIRAFNPAIAILVVTAETDVTVKDQALAAGARTVLIKPVHLPDILTALGHEPGAAGAMSPSGTEAEEAETSIAPGPRVLVVDDDATLRETLVDFLAARSYRVLAAADAVSAIRTIAETEPHVMLLDIDMPSLSGTDALPTIRAMAPGTVVIMVSGTSDEAIAKRALAFGAFDYIVKPVNYDYLAASLETALAMKALETER